MSRSLDAYGQVFCELSLGYKRNNCASLLDVSLSYLTALSIAYILEFGWRMN